MSLQGATLVSVEAGPDPSEEPSKILPPEDVLELRTVVIRNAGEDAEMLIAHYEELLSIFAMRGKGPRRGL